MNWKKPSESLPIQGLKILHFCRGDVCVAQRFGDYWFPIPFTDSKYAKLEEPEFWSNIDFPEGYKGLLRVIVQGELLNIDEYEEKYPEEFKEFYNQIIDHMRENSNE